MARRSEVEGGPESGDAAAKHRGIVADHLRTFRGTKRPLWWQLFTQVFLPVIVGGFALGGGARITIVSELIAGSSIVAGLLFALVIFVFQLRLGLSTDPRVQSKVALPDLIDQLFASVLYAVTASFAFVVAALIFAALEPVDKRGDLLGLDPWMGAVLIVFGIHLLSVIAFCLTRTRRAYLELAK